MYLLVRGTHVTGGDMYLLVRGTHVTGGDRYLLVRGTHVTDRRGPVPVGKGDTRDRQEGTGTCW